MGILIIIAFSALIYGMYFKISTSANNIEELPTLFSAKLLKNENIKNIEVLDKNTLLILIEKEGNIRGVIYDIKKNQIMNLIDK